MSERENPLWTATLNRGGPGYAELSQIFADGEHIPLRSPVAQQGRGPVGELLDFYFIDSDQVPLEKLQRAAEIIGVRWGIPPAEVLHDLLGEHGCPVREENIIVAFSLRAFL